MPTYDFICEKCEKPFTLIISLAEYEKKDFLRLFKMGIDVPLYRPSAAVGVQANSCQAVRPGLLGQDNSHGGMHDGKN